MLVVAGDMQHGSTQAVATVAHLVVGKPCVFVLGNHEPWHRELGAERAAARRAAARQGGTLLDDTEATLAGARFVGGILWADGRLGGQDAAPGQVTGEMVRVARVGGRTCLITNGDEARLHATTSRLIEGGTGQFWSQCLPRGDSDLLCVASLMHTGGLPAARASCVTRQDRGSVMRSPATIWWWKYDGAASSSESNAGTEGVLACNGGSWAGRTW